MWYLTRGTGFVTLVLLTLSVLLGVAEVVRWASPRWPRFITAALHRNVSLLVMVLLALHIVTSVADGFAPIRWLDVVVPFTSPYRPVWLGLGALAVDLLLALVVTSLLRERIGYRAWRAVHWTSYACWPLAVVHGLGAGSDTRLGWALLLNLGCIAAVLAAVWWRLATGWPANVRTRAVAAGASVIAPLVLLGWMLGGPMKSGWAVRAGTPTALLGAQPASATGGGAAAPTTATPPSGSTGALPLPFTASMAGSLAQSGPDSGGRSTITIDATLRAGATGRLHVVLQGPAVGGGVEMQQSSATFGPAGQPTLYQGRISALQGTSMVLTLQDRAGHPLRLSIALQIDGATAVSGTVQGSG